MDPMLPAYFSCELAYCALYQVFAVLTVCTPSRRCPCSRGINAFCSCAPYSSAWVVIRAHVRPSICAIFACRLCTPTLAQPRACLLPVLPAPTLCWRSFSKQDSRVCSTPPGPTCELLYRSSLIDIARAESPPCHDLPGTPPWRLAMPPLLFSLNYLSKFFIYSSPSPTGDLRQGRTKY